MCECENALNVPLNDAYLVAFKRSPLYRVYNTCQGILRYYIKEDHNVDRIITYNMQSS